jgi:hypothetical protein
MQTTNVTGLKSLTLHREGAVTLDSVKADATASKAPHVIEAQDGRHIIVCPGGAVMGTSQPYGKADAYDLAFRVALTRDWAWPVERTEVVA